MNRLLTILLLFVLVASNGNSQTRATTRKKKGLKVAGVSDLFPQDDTVMQMRWYVKWTARDKLSDWYLRKFMELLKEEQAPWKKALDKEEFNKKPRERYLKYFKSHVKWYDDMHACVKGIAENKMAILPIIDNPQPAYVKKRTALQSKNTELLRQFRDIVSNKPKKVKKG